MTSLFLFIVFLLVWFLPTFIAKSRNHKYTKRCFWVNLLVGWTVILWIPMMVWSLVSKAE